MTDTPVLPCWYCQGRERREYRAKVSKLEGQVAALRDELLMIRGALGSPGPAMEALFVLAERGTAGRLDTLLADTAQAATEHDARVRAESAARIERLEEALHEILALTGADQWGNAIDGIAIDALAPDAGGEGKKP